MNLLFEIRWFFKWKKLASWDAKYEEMYKGMLKRFICKPEKMSSKICAKNRLRYNIDTF